jgi:hypothetical protein
LYRIEDYEALGARLQESIYCAELVMAVLEKELDTTVPESSDFKSVRKMHGIGIKIQRLHAALNGFSRTHRRFAAVAECTRPVRYLKIIQVYH